MAVHETYDTDDSAVPRALRRFVRNRAYELSGLVLLTGVITTALSLASWSVTDPSFNHATDAEPANWLGYPGAAVADVLIQYLGLASLVLVLIPLVWVYRLFCHEHLPGLKHVLLSWPMATVGTTVLASSLPTPASWPLAGGLGGQIGDSIANIIIGTLSIGLKPLFAELVSFLSGAVAAIWCGLKAVGLTGAGTKLGASASVHLLRTSARRALHGASASAAALVGGAISAGNLFRRTASLALGRKKAGLESDAADILTRLAPTRGTMRGKRKLEPSLTFDSDNPVILPGADTWEMEEEEPEQIAVPKTAPRPRRKVAADVFDLPELDLLAEPKRPSKQLDISPELLEENARALEGVLDDFGVKGQIINVRPGPVVTLYELEPAPGIKSSRVISLADDIARSMSAISARVAVVQGRNVIGIELPNAKRETVYLREMFAADAFMASTAGLCVALGKNIGGEPIYADLARMPHLLIAGTTGSGKSVGINTMILSLLYRLPPERCKLIMIDPKMLELSVYEGIPHLLAPVVTDPKKAVVALKWAVREMEERYKKMS